MERRLPHPRQHTAYRRPQWKNEDSTRRRRGWSRLPTGRGRYSARAYRTGDQAARSAPSDRLFGALISEQQISIQNPARGGRAMAVLRGLLALLCVVSSAESQSFKAQSSQGVTLTPCRLRGVDGEARS